MATKFVGDDEEAAAVLKQMGGTQGITAADAANDPRSVLGRLVDALGEYQRITGKSMPPERFKEGFREEDHPRADDGKFGSGGGSSGSSSSNEPKRHVVQRTANTTWEGITLDKAGKLTPEEARHALVFMDGMTLIGGSNKPNTGLPDGTRPKLTDLEAGALQKYSYKNDGPLNALLRKGELPEGSPYNETFFHEMHAQMQAAFDKAPVLSKPVPVVRGMKLEPEVLNALIGSMKQAGENGEPISFKGYTSTAKPSGLLAKLGLASGIPGPFRGNVSLKINAIHGLDMMPYSQLTGEGEMLLPHGAQFKVKSMTKKGDGWHIELDQLPPTGRKEKLMAIFKSDGEEGKEPTAEEMAAFYSENPEAVGKFIDTDADFINFGTPSEDKAALPDLLKRLQSRLKGG